MNAEELREQYRNSPEWAYVSLAVKVAQLEKEVAALKPKKRTRKKAKA